MANTRQFLGDRFFVVNGAGKVQSAQGVPMVNADLNYRLKAAITREEIIVRREYRNCRDEDFIGSKIRTRLARYTLAFTEVNPHLIGLFSALLLGSSLAPTGTPANEAQSIAVAGDGTIALTLEGRTVTTAQIESTGITAQAIQDALTDPRMLFIQPGDVVVTGGSSPFTATFPETGRLGRANIPLMVGTGGITVSASANGDQRFHDFARSTTRAKKFISFAMGWDTNEDRVEKYIDYVIERVNPTVSLDGDVGMTVQFLGPWGHDSIEAAFDIPDCVNIDPLAAQDVRVLVDGAYESVDVNSLSLDANDNIPIDTLSAFGFDGQDVQNLLRGRQPTYSWSGSFFGDEESAIYQLAQNERTETAVPVLVHFGFPGNRTTWNYPASEMRFQTNRWGTAGAAEYAVVNVEGFPTMDGLNPPLNVDAYLDQSTQFLIS